MSESLQGKRVVLVVAWAVLGGAERSAFEVMRWLRDREGAYVEVLAFTDDEGRFRDAVAETGVAWHSCPLSWHGGKIGKARSLVALTHRLRALRPDVVAPYTSRPNVLCGLVWRATGASLCVWNQQDLVLPTKFSRTLVRRAARMTPLLIANSQAAADYLVSRLGVPVERVRVIREGVQRFKALEDRSAWRARLGVDERTLAVSMLGHLHRGKDHATLLRAWATVVDRLRESDRNAVLLLAGRPSGTEDAAKALAFDLELGSSVRFLGDVPDVGGLLEATDIAVLSSPSESAPHAVLESMSVGLPIAATDIPGIRQVVGVPQLPYLAPPGDAGALAAAIITLAADPDLRRELGEQNRSLVAESATVPAAEATAAAIARALADRTRS